MIPHPLIWDCCPGLSLVSAAEAAKWVVSTDVRRQATTFLGSGIGMRRQIGEPCI